LAAGNAKKITANTDGKSTPEVESKLPSSVATSAAPKAPKPNPFGAAKPVDTLQKELEIEQKLEREKTLLEEKLKKEAQETKAVPSISTAIKGPSGAAAPEITAATSSANQSSNTPPTPATQPRSRWTQPPPVSKPATNGNVPPSAPSAAAPPPVAKSAPSPLSPSLSSFRKEGISFAALAKTAAANPTSNPPTTTTSKPSTKEEQSSKSMAQQPRAILKRVEGLEIKHE
jgi:hypothetical protein